MKTGKENMVSQSPSLQINYTGLKRKLKNIYVIYELQFFSNIKIISNCLYRDILYM